MCISPGRGVTGVILNNLFFKKTKSQKCQKTKCLQNLNKNCLKLDSRPILYVYNLLGYGETLSEKYGKSQKMSEIFENVRTFCNIFQNFQYVLKMSV